MSREPKSEMLRPPVNRAMRVLDRSFFKRSVPLAAARVLSIQQIAECRKALMQSRDLLLFNGTRVPPIRPDPSPELASQGRKCILLREGIKADDASTWPPSVQALSSASRVDIIPYQLDLTYDSWDYGDIIESILPEDLEEKPYGFTQAGHVAHFNLRDHLTPYKTLIAEVLRDKMPVVETVINKTDNVGDENEFRTFSYEVLAGKDDLNVEVREGDCVFAFNFAQVYWNSRLETEHRRLVSTFKEGEAICDVMAGVGPFACPAGKKKVFAWANDLNPASFEALSRAISRNKLQDYVKAFNVDGHEFIKSSARNLWRDERSVEIKPRQPRYRSIPHTKGRTLLQPRCFDHYVLNLPASALEFLRDFIGLYSSISETYSAPTPTLDTVTYPLIHAYCFSLKGDDNKEAMEDIRRRVSEYLGFEMRIGSMETEGELSIYDVRDVAPKKRMFCASFRLPKEVAWRETPRDDQ